MTTYTSSFIASASWITLFADASFCPDTGAYGWCFWIKHGSPAKTTLRSGGGLGMKGSHQAEVEALRQGLQEIETLGILGKNIVIQSDCLGALNTIEAELEKFRTAGAKRAYSKHVKGHQGHKDKRSSVNTICDQRAGECMMKFRQQARQQGVRRGPAR